MALSDEEVLEEAMVRAQQERTELRAKSIEDSGRGGGGLGGTLSWRPRTWQSRTWWPRQGPRQQGRL